MMGKTGERGAGGAVCLVLLLSASVSWAQDDPFGAELDDEAEAEAGGETETGDDEPAEDAEPEPQAEPDVEADSETESEGAGESGTEASGEVGGSIGVSLSGSAQADADPDVETATAEEAASSGDVLFVGSHIRRPRLMYEGKPVITTPLTTTLRDREFLQTVRQHGGIALPDTAAALGIGGSGTTRLGLRVQPTLVLLNGRRLVPAPFFGGRGADFVDVAQIPITLIDRVEITSGLAAGLWGDGAIGGVYNFVTKRDYEGLEVELGGQATDKFDQSDADVTLTVGAGSEDTGMNAMVSYFRREPLAAGDRDWIGERTDRVESLTGAPASFQPSRNFDYTFPDPLCDIAVDAGHSTGLEVRIMSYGPPETLGALPEGPRNDALMNNDVARGDGDGVLEAGETSTYCASDFTGSQDLVLKEERIQSYTTFWHALSEHTEAFGELGYYRNDNENRTAAAFPIVRSTPDRLNPNWVPGSHADIPLASRGFEGAVGSGRGADLFIVGRTQGTYNGSDTNTRQLDVWRGVLGLSGDLEDVGSGSVLESWDWSVAGAHSVSESTTRVNDILLDKLTEALASCEATKTDLNTREIVPTTIKERQEAGCFNPFYNSVTNNSAIDPLGLATDVAPAEDGFITSDTDPNNNFDGFGFQDGGAICDPSDPDSPPCPAAFDRDNDGIFELAGTPNTKQVIDAMTGEQITQQRRELTTVDGIIRGDIVDFSGGGLSFGLGAQFRREFLHVDYDAAYNQRLYAFLFGGDDVEPVSRNIAAGHLELGLRLSDGLLELQPAARIEHYEGVGASLSPLLGAAVRPFAASDSPPEVLEWLLVRGHFGIGHRAPSLLQLYGTQTSFQTVDYLGGTSFLPHVVTGNAALDFEKYTTISGGVQWDFKGIHVGADFWTTAIDDMIGADNARTLVSDCEKQFDSGVPCDNLISLVGLQRSISHIESDFDNLAEVDTNGIDGSLMYTLDTQRRGLGELGTFVVGVTGTYINSYLIKSPRALRHVYRECSAAGLADPDLDCQEPVQPHVHALSADQPTHAVPRFNPDGTRDYSVLKAEYEAAGFRNAENFAPPMPKLRFSVPLRWIYEGHMLGVTMRYVDGYNDDSEHTIERYGLPGIDQIQFADGEAIPSWTVFDLGYGFAFGDEAWRNRISLGVINILDEPPPEVESSLGYEVGVHDPRGRMIYARLRSQF